MWAKAIRKIQLCGSMKQKLERLLFLKREEVVRGLNKVYSSLSEKDVVRVPNDVYTAHGVRKGEINGYQKKSNQSIMIAKKG